MIPVPSGGQVWLATGFTDMRKGFDGLAALVQDHLRRDPFSGQAFVFRGRQGRLIKVLWWMARAFVCLRSGLRGDASFGLPLRVELRRC
jgi:transposase